MKTYYDKFNGRDVYLYTIKSDMVEVDICELGARINSIRVNGVDIALGFDSVEGYLESGSYAGSTIGRVANRIADSRFFLNGIAQIASVCNISVRMVKKDIPENSILL